MSNKKVNMGTQAVWSGEKDVLVHGATQVPVVVSVAYNYDDMDEWYDVATGKKPGHIYGRNTNPTVQAFEEKVRIMEGAEAATSFSTGMAAISNIFYTFLRPGDRIVSIKDTYGGTNKIFTEFLPQMNIEIVLCETGNHEEMEREIEKGCKIVYLESPTNPTVKITDIERIAKKEKKSVRLLWWITHLPHQLIKNRLNSAQILSFIVQRNSWAVMRMHLVVSFADRRN